MLPSTTFELDQLNLTFSALSPISNFPWITYNQTTRSFSVYTQENSISGSYTIALVQNFTNFPGFNPFAQF